MALYFRAPNPTIFKVMQSRKFIAARDHLNHVAAMGYILHPSYGRGEKGYIYSFVLINIKMR